MIERGERDEIQKNFLREIESRRRKEYKLENKSIEAKGHIKKIENNCVELYESCHLP